MANARIRETGSRFELSNVRRVEELWTALEPVGRLRDLVAPLLRPLSPNEPGQLKARADTIRFVRRLPGTARSFASPRLFRDWAVAQAPPGGLFLEFGVSGGVSMRQLAQRMKDLGLTSRLYGFDSLQGLPEDWRPGISAGAFQQRSLPAVGDNAALVVGMFQDTLPVFLKEHSETVSFAHIDCDLYSSAHYVLSSLLSGSRLVNGSVLVFDELMNYPDWTSGGEYRALNELLPTGSVGYEFIAFAPIYEQVAIRIVDRSNPAATPSLERANP